VRTPGRSGEEQAAEVVETAGAGTTAGVGKPVPVDSRDLDAPKGTKAQERSFGTTG
jgi:hypothetical protein